MTENNDIIICVHESADDVDQICFINITALSKSKNKYCKIYADALNKAMSSHRKRSTLDCPTFMYGNTHIKSFVVQPPCYVTDSVTLREGDYDYNAFKNYKK